MVNRRSSAGGAVKQAQEAGEEAPSRALPRTASGMAGRAVSRSKSIGKGVAGLAGASVKLYGELARTMVGMSEREVPAKDPRFADPAWRGHPMYRRHT